MVNSVAEEIITDMRGNSTQTFETLNEISRAVGGNYKTVQKIVSKFVEKGIIQQGNITKQNRDYIAYSTNSNIYRAIQDELKEIQKTTAYIKSPHVKMIQPNENTEHINNTSDYSKNGLQTVGELNIIQLAKQNEELKSKVAKLEHANKTLELDKVKEISSIKELTAKEISQITSEKVQIQADLYKAQADIKLIEDKSKTMESAYSEQKLEVQRLNKVIRNRNIALMVLGAVLLVIMAVGVTLSLVR